MFKSKKNIIIGIILTFIISIIAVIVYAFYDAGKSEEIWAFRDKLDETFFPIRDEVESCIFGEKEEKGRLICNKESFENQLENTKLTLSNYQPKHTDTQNLKRKVIESISILEEIIATNDKLSPNDNNNFIKLSNHLFDEKEKLEQNKKEIHKILDKYYN